MSVKRPSSTSRLRQDYLRLKRDPVPYITAEPLPTNIHEWHYVVRGPENTPYYGGFYHGTLLFPREYPFKPPSIYMFTPNGRFKVNQRLCLSISDYHPDTWNPAWSVATILTGLLSFMVETTPTLGSMRTSLQEKQLLAKKSLAHNLRNEHFRELFPEICEEISGRIRINGGSGDPSVDAELNIAQNGTQTAGAMPNGANSNNDAGQANGVGGARNTAATDTEWSSLASTIAVVICSIIFALIANHVMKSLAE